MKYKISLLFIMLLLLCVNVIAVGEAGKPYSFYNVGKCYGDIKARVYPLGNENYTLINCTQNSINDWVCSCRTNLSILTPSNVDSRFSILVQYYIAQPKNFTPSTDGKPTAEEIYNDGLKRVYTIKDIIITKNKEAFVNGALSENDKINNVLLGALMVVGGIVLVAFLTILLMWLFDERLRKWIGLKDDEKMTIGKILKRIFTRESITRKELVRKDGSVLPTIRPVEVKPITKQEQKKNNTEEEIRKILEGLDN